MSGVTAVAGWTGAAWGCGPGHPAQTGAGTVEALPPLRTVGLQLSTVRELLARDMEGTFRQIAETGYRNVETSADLYEKVPAAELRAMLDRYRLRSPTGLYRYDQLRTELPSVIQAARTLGQEYVGIPGLPQSLQSPDGFPALADRFNQWGAHVNEAGMTLMYHNHLFEFEMHGGRPGYDLLLERTDPSLVAFELDVYWMHKAGFDPIAYFEQFPGRFPVLHLKDSTAAPEKDFAPVGEGVLDFRQILSYAATAGYRYGMVEHDGPRNPLQSIQNSYAYLARILPQS